MNRPTGFGCQIESSIQDVLFFVSSHLKYEITYRKLALRMCVGFRREPSEFNHASMRLIDSTIDLNFKPYLSIYSIDLIVLVFELRTHINRHIPQITYKEEVKKRQIPKGKQKSLDNHEN